MITALVILAVVLTILVAVGLVAMVSDSGIFGWFATIQGIVNTSPWEDHRPAGEVPGVTRHPGVDPPT